MRPSRYNYIVPDGDTTVFFNGITEAFFRVPTRRTDTYRTIIENPDPHREGFGDFLSRMEERGFIVADDADELAAATAKFNMQRNPDTYYMMILPTYQCNLRCWYCTQDHQELWMSAETVGLIKRRLENRISDPAVRTLQLAWFGGEPLMAYDIVIELTRFAHDLATKADKRFVCSITSNSTLLTPDRIDALREAGVGSYQITIDGDRLTHDKIKVLADGRSAYDVALANITHIARSSHCTLRFNYTHENLRPQAIIDDVIARLPEEVRPNITFFLAQVWQEDDKQIDQTEVSKLYTLANSHGLKTQHSVYGLCYVDWCQFECVFPNGHVGLCDNNDPTDNPGRLMPDGTVEWPQRINCGKPAFEVEDGPCRECRYNPVCGGPCPAKRQIMLEKYGRIYCLHPDKKTAMENDIRKKCLSMESFQPA